METSSNAECGIRDAEFAVPAGSETRAERGITAGDTVSPHSIPHSEFRIPSFLRLLPSIHLYRRSPPCSIRGPSFPGYEPGADQARQQAEQMRLPGDMLVAGDHLPHDEATVVRPQRRGD